MPTFKNANFLTFCPFIQKVYYCVYMKGLLLLLEHKFCSEIVFLELKVFSNLLSHFLFFRRRLRWEMCLRSLGRRGGRARFHRSSKLWNFGKLVFLILFFPFLPSFLSFFHWESEKYIPTDGNSTFVEITTFFSLYFLVSRRLSSTFRPIISHIMNLEIRSEKSVAQKRRSAFSEALQLWNARS